VTTISGSAFGFVIPCNNQRIYKTPPVKASVNPNNQWYEGSTRHTGYGEDHLMYGNGKFLRGDIWGTYRNGMTVGQNHNSQLGDYDQSWNNDFNNNKVVVNTSNRFPQYDTNAPPDGAGFGAPPQLFPQSEGDLLDMKQEQHRQQLREQFYPSFRGSTSQQQQPQAQQQRQFPSPPKSDIYQTASNNSNNRINQQKPQIYPTVSSSSSNNNMFNQQKSQLYPTGSSSSNNNNDQANQQTLDDEESKKSKIYPPIPPKDEEPIQYMRMQKTPRLEQHEIYPGWNDNTHDTSQDSMQDYDRQDHMFHEFPAITSHNNYDHSDAGPFDVTWKEYRHQYDGKNMVLSLPMDANLRERYREAPRTYQYYGDKPPANWLETYYDMFLRRSQDDSMIINELLNQLQYDDPIAITAGTNRYDRNGGDDVLLEQVASFVQGAIAYDVKTARNLNHKMNRYPYETLFDRTGVCTDKSLLFVRLAMTLGYDVGLFIFDKANHMAVGVRVPQGYGDFNSDYAFLETTNYAPIGQIPNTYMNDIKLDGSNATLVTLPSIRGKNNGIYTKIMENKEQEKFQEMRYGREYLFLGSEQRQLKEQMAELQDQIDYWANQLDQYDSANNDEERMLPIDEFEVHQEIHYQHNSRVEAYNELVARFNSINQQQHQMTPIK